MSRLASFSTYLFPTLPLKRELDPSRHKSKSLWQDRRKWPTYKQRKLSGSEHGSRQSGVGWAGAEWRWLGEARSQQASDQTFQFNISNHLHCLEPQQGYYGILRDFLHSLTLSVTDSYLLWLTLRELEACWEEGCQANWLSSSWLMVGFGRNGSSPPFFSTHSLEIINPAGMCWQRWLNSASWFALSFYP